MSTEPEFRPGSDLSQLLQRLQDLVKSALDAEKKELISSSSFLKVHQELLNIRKNMELFQENYKKSLSQLGLTPEDLKPTPEEIEKLNPKDKKLWEQLEFLRVTCEEAKERAYKSMKEDKTTLQTVTEELKDRGSKKSHRRSKFKGAGGKKGWLPT